MCVCVSVQAGSTHLVVQEKCEQIIASASPRRRVASRIALTSLGCTSLASFSGRFVGGGKTFFPIPQIGLGTRLVLALF